MWNGANLKPLSDDARLPRHPWKAVKNHRSPKAGCARSSGHPRSLQGALWDCGTSLPLWLFWPRAFHVQTPAPWNAPAKESQIDLKLAPFGSVCISLHCECSSAQTRSMAGAIRVSGRQPRGGQPLRLERLRDKVGHAVLSFAAIPRAAQPEDLRGSLLLVTRTDAGVHLRQGSRHIVIRPDVFEAIPPCYAFPFTNAPFD